MVDALITAKAREEASVLDRLTDRETEVLAEMATGGSNAAIGEALFISPRSVEKHINSIFTKLDLPPGGGYHIGGCAPWCLYLGAADDTGG